ncbi:MAG: fibronectin type III-like domain-contianing protein, partial [Bacteroidota bacterium]
YGDVNPSGKLPFSMARHEKDYPPFTPYAKNITYGYYHGYTLFDKKKVEVAYPFGFGLSYTQFAFSELTILEPTIGTEDTLRVRVTLSNTGAMAGAEVVQLYIGFQQSEVDRPVKLLRDFKKVYLEAGESQIVELAVAAKDLAWYNPDHKAWEIEPMVHELYVGSSAAPEDLLTDQFSIRE